MQDETDMVPNDTAENNRSKEEKGDAKNKKPG